MDLSGNEWYIQAPWGRICVTAWGNCFDPPVLLCHGAMDSVASFKPLLRMLPQNFYYIGMELPGNGRSDPFPPGLMINIFDLVHPIELVRRHFRWEEFMYISHSIATMIGKLYNVSYPGRMSRVVELDPVPYAMSVPAEKFAEWYEAFFSNYYKNYEMYNSPRDNGPKYTREEAIEKLMKNRGLPRDVAVDTVDRVTDVTEDGFVRFTFDQRNKIYTRPPFSPEQVRELFTSIPTPTLAIVAAQSVDWGMFKKLPFLLQEDAFPNRSYRVRQVVGTHDVHAIDPQSIAPYVTQLLLRGLEGIDNKAKL